MKNIIIFGAGGLGGETHWLLSRINECKETWNTIGFCDDTKEVGEVVNGLAVVGGMQYLLQYNECIHVVVAIADAKARKKIVQHLKENKNIIFPNLIDPSVLYSPTLKFGEGNLFFANSILTVNIQMKDFNVISFGCTVGHDDNFSSFVTLYPSVNVSGNVSIGECCEIGTGSQIIQKLNIGSYVIVGAGSVVIKDIPNDVIAVGVPTRIVKKI